jgi:hypothetical protein
VPAACVPIEAGDSFYAEPQVIAFSRERGDSSGSAQVKAVAGQESPRAARSRSRTRSPSPVSSHKYFAVLLHGDASDAEAQASLIGAGWRRCRRRSRRAREADS